MFQCILYYIKFQVLGIVLLISSLLSGKTLKYHFASKMQKIFKVKLKRKQGSHEISNDKKIFFLFNHTSWADFFIDHVLTGGTYLARWAALLAMTFLSLYMWGVHGEEGFFRKKGSRKNIEKLVDKVFKRTKNKQFIIYPEGTRNTTGKIQDLKWGMIKMSYEKKIPTQIIIVSNKEKVFNEKKGSANGNVECEFYANKILDPKLFSSLEDYHQAITTEWEKSWNKAFDTNLKSEKYFIDKKRFKTHERLNSNFRINTIRIIFLLGIIYLFKNYLYTLALKTIF